jgi:hypothetical protein
VSFNIDKIDVIHRKDFSIARSKLVKLRRFYKNHSQRPLPEGCIITDPENCFDDWDDPSVKTLQVNRFWFYGEGSGHAEAELSKILEAFDGEADLVICWEGGEAYSGLRLRNHVVTTHEVIMQLGEETK